MKKFFVYMASAAFMFAACNKADIDVPVEDVNTPVETETITVDLNPMTKTSLDGMNTVWSDGDVVRVTVEGKKIGDLKLVEGSTFTGEVEAGHTGVAVLNYPSDKDAVPTTQTAVENSFANGSALLEGTTTMEALRAGEGATLQNQTAILGFSSPIAGNVAFTIGNATYTVTGCDADKTYYVCVDPANSGKLSYTAGLALGAKEKDSFAPEANKVYSLGALTFKQSTTYGLVGTNNNWTDEMMYETSQDNFYVLYGVEFSAAGQFKIRKKGVWETEYNYGTTTDSQKDKNSVVGVFTDEHSKDIKVKAGTYDIYFDRLAGQIYLMEPGKAHASASKPTSNTTYCLAGSHNGWGDTAITYSGDGIWTVCQNFTANTQWKIKIKGNWSQNWGQSVVTTGKSLTSTNNDGNVIMKNAGDYIVAFVKDWNEITIVTK